MKTAIPTNDKISISNVFGRAEYFAIFDESGIVEILDNRENAKLPGGAGINTAQALIKNEVNRIITIDFGPKAKDTIKDRNIEVIMVKEEKTINDLIKQYNGQQ